MEFNATFLISAISFIIFVFIMNTIFYKPILRIMEERKAFIEKNEQKIADANNQSKELEEKKEREIQSARANAKATVDNGLERVKSENKEIMNNFTEEQKQRAENEKRELNKESINSKEELKEKSKNISRIITNKILEVENV